VTPNSKKTFTAHHGASDLARVCVVRHGELQFLLGPWSCLAISSLAPANSWAVQTYARRIAGSFSFPARRQPGALPKGNGIKTSRFPEALPMVAGAAALNHAWRPISPRPESFIY